MLVVCVAGCGGRVSMPVKLVQPLDDVLTCDHLQAEYENNLKRMHELAGERADQMRDNIGWTASFLTAGPIFLDLKDTEKKEGKALAERNVRLHDLAVAKTCSSALPISTESAVVAPSLLSKTK
jgi:hypothetical protein